MNAKPIYTIAVLMHFAITLSVLMAALVSQDLKETDGCAMMLMNAKPIHTIAVFTHSAVTLLVLLAVLVCQDSQEMDGRAMILMNAKPIHTIAVFMHSVVTLLVLLAVLVSQDSKGMDGRATTLMNAKPAHTIAVFMLSAVTVLDLLAVLVSQDSKGMDGRAMTLMNVGMGLPNVTETRHAQTLKALTNAPAFLGFMVTVKCVEMSTNVWIDHMTAVWMRLAGTLWALILVRARTVFVETVVYAPTSMSVVMEVIFVTLMLDVLTSQALTAASAKMGTVAMDDTAMVSTKSTSMLSITYFISPKATEGTLVAFER